MCLIQAVLAFQEVQEVSLIGTIQIVAVLTEGILPLNVEVQAVSMAQTVQIANVPTEGVPAENVEVRVVFRDLASRHRHPIRSTFGR
jgi:hypothetical protein